jgi:hypothetical protein
VARREYGTIVAIVVYLLFAVNFNAYRVFGDGEVAYAFLRRLFGEDVDAVGYQFGLALMNAPFFAAGKLASAAGLRDFQDAPVGPATISLASNAYVVGAVVIVAALLIAMGIPHRGWVLAAAVFGTPLWYYASFSPSYSHAADTFLVTAGAGLVFLLFRSTTTRPQLPVAIGAVLGLAATVRYLDFALVAGLAVVLLVYGRRRDALLVAATSAATFGVLLLVPVAVGAPIFAQHYRPASLGFSPLSPLQMLFTNHRGLFIWTPLTILSVIGFWRLLLVRRDERPFLVALGVMSLSLLAAQVAVPFWDAGWSFSQRYFTALFALYAIGLAGLASWRPRLTAALATLTVAWSLFIGLNHVFGGAQQTDGAYQVADIVFSGERSVGEFLDLFWIYSRLKYAVP